MTPKYRVVDENGKVLAIESIHDAKWWYCNVVTVAGKDSVEPWQLGTYPHPGKRLAFTGKVDKHGREIFDQSKLNDGRIIRTVFWSDDELSWMVTGQIADDLLSNFSSKRLEVITSETDR